MTIQNIKDKFEFKFLSMVRQFSKDGVKQEWLSHWDNERRIRVTMHQNIFEYIKSNPSVDDLDYKVQEVAVNHERKAYTRIVIVKEYKLRNNDFPPDDTYRSTYDAYNNAFGYDDDAIDDAFNGDPSNVWNID